MALYAQRGDRRCPDCLAFPDAQNSKHWRSCVPRRYWPRWLGGSPEMSDSELDALEDGGAVLAAAVAEDEAIGQVFISGALDDVTCACGKVCASAFGLRSHQRSHKAAEVAS